MGRSPQTTTFPKPSPDLAFEETGSEKIAEFEIKDVTVTAALCPRGAPVPLKICRELKERQREADELWEQLRCGTDCAPKSGKGFQKPAEAPGVTPEGSKVGVK